MDVSENRGTPKWMVYNGKPYENGMIWGENPPFSETPIYVLWIPRGETFRKSCGRPALAFFGEWRMGELPGR